MDKILHDAEIVTEYTELIRKFRHIQGFLHPEEGFTLMKFAEEGPGTGEIVEIGSWMGKSTAWLAIGAQKKSNAKVTAIDHFKGSPEHQPGQPFSSEELKQNGTTFHKFIENINSLGLIDYVDTIIATSEEAVKNWTKTIRLLFIDGNHSYENTKQDFCLWFPFVCNKGIICFHDVGTWEGCTKFYQELIQSSNKVREIADVLTLRVVQKI